MTRLPGLAACGKRVFCSVELCWVKSSPVLSSLVESSFLVKNANKSESRFCVESSSVTSSWVLLCSVPLSQVSFLKGLVNDRV